MNGLRHEPTGDTTGWYIWCGHYSSEDDFFQPIHTGHLYQQYPELKSILGLPPGYRFLIAPDMVDIWFDDKLLSIEG